MEEIVTYNEQLPANIEDLAKFAIFNSEKLRSLKAEISAIDKLCLAKEVYDQKIEEQRLLAELVLDAFVKLGEFSKKLPKVNRNQHTVKVPCDSTVAEQKSKTEIMKNLGFTPKQVERFEILANNPDVVEEVKHEARENDDLPTRSRVIDLVKQREREQDEIKKRDAESSKLYRKFHNAVFDILLLYDNETDSEDEKLDMLTEWIEECNGITVRDYISDITDVIDRLEIIRAHFTRHERSKNNG